MTHCKNCGGHFTPAEMQQRKPPLYAWRLTPVGEQTAHENAANNDTRRCPECGCTTLR